MLNAKFNFVTETMQFWKNNLKNSVSAK